MSVRTVNSASGSFSIVLAALSLSNVTPESAVLSVTGDATPRSIGAQIFVFDDINPQDADFSFGLSEGEALDFAIESDPLATAASDLIVTVCGSAATVDLENTGYEVIGPQTVSGNQISFGYLADTAEGDQVTAWEVAGVSATSLAAITVAFSSCVEEFNCDCEAVSPYKTLAALKTEMYIGMGYAAQSSNPPPGMATLAAFYLREAQEFLWLRYSEVRTERFYKWTMVPGLRYYGIRDNENCCFVRLDPKKVTWVGFEDLNRTWVPMVEGIPPEFYTRAQITTGWPSRYEIRECIEIFPAPQAAYTLWVKGNFGLAALTADTDRTTIDDRAVLWFALGLSGRGPMAGDVGKGMALQRIKDITAGQHNTARFIPRPGGPRQPLTPPRYLPLGDEPS